MRTIKKVTTSPAHPGFLGAGHTASAVVDGNNFQETDPFMALMDDRLDLPGGPPVGGPHPHAGFETVTFVVEGHAGEWKTGSLEMMTAGKGVVHTEEITERTNVRILQSWLVLPPEHRNAEPSVQKMFLEHVPTFKTANAEVRVYSGTSHDLTSPLHNLTPLTLLDVRMDPQTELREEIPADQNGFIYVIEGAVHVGNDRVKEGQAGWFSASDANSSEARFQTAEQGTRFVLYTAKPHHAPVVAHGPFIADSAEDIHRLYREYRQGRMPHVNDLPADRHILHEAVV